MFFFLFGKPQLFILLFTKLFLSGMLRLFLIIFCLGSASGQTCKDCITAAFSATGACASVPCTSSYCQICQTNATDTARANAIPPTCFWDTQGCALKTCGEQNCSAVCGAAKRCLLTNPIPETVPATLFFQWMLQQNSTNTAFGTVDRTGVNGANFNTDPTYCEYLFCMITFTNWQ